jgi:hypothetical protein
VEQEKVDKIVNEYEVPLDQLYRSVKTCNNQAQPTTLDYADDGSYPACFFGLNYLEGQFDSDFPSRTPGCNPVNKDVLPDWLKNTQDDDLPACVDSWNIPA